MVNFNPFKKKENEFKLDDHSLPSLSDIGDPGAGVPTQGSSSTLPDLNSSSSSQQDFSLNSPSLDPMPMPELPASSTGLGMPAPTGGEVGNSAFPSMSSSMSSSGNQSNNSEPTLDAQISKAKLESMDSKVTLIDARLSNIEQKLEILTKLILEEVSDETKRKLNVQSMMNNIK